jgi:hypothetical protein
MSMIFYLFNILTIKMNVYLVYIFIITKDDKLCFCGVRVDPHPQFLVGFV